jgi:lipopolysaccharide export system permease protein
MITPCVISMAFLLFVFMMTQLIDLTDMVVNYRVPFSTVLLLLAYTIPAFLQFIIPMSVMIGVLLGFLKMSSDNEIIAMKAGGISIYAMLPPVLVFCMMGSIITAFMGIYGQPWGRLAEKTLESQLSTASITALFKEQTVIRSFEKRTLYITHIEQNTLEGIFIEDLDTAGQAVIITAPKGRLIADPDGSQIYHLQLEDGQINRTDAETRSVSATNFATCLIRLDLTTSLDSSQTTKKEKEMTLSELRQFIESREKKDDHYYIAEIAFHSKFALPFACFALGILGVPLGVQSKSARKTFGTGLGLFFFLGYYLILSAGEVYGRTGYYPPAIGMWMPNIVMGGIGMILLVRCARERAIGIGWLLFLFSRKSHPGADDDTPPSPPTP